MTRSERARTRIRRCAVATVLAALLLSGCGGAHRVRDDAVAADDSGPIVVAGGKDVSASGVRRKLVDAWNQTHGPSRQAKLVELPGSADEQRSQLVGALQSGSASYDVVNLDLTWVPEFAEAGLIRPLGAAATAVPDDVIPKVRATGSWKGRTYAVPFNTDAGLLYYRADYLQDLGLPVPGRWTWDTLESTITALSRAKGRQDARLPEAYDAAWVGQWQEYEGLTVNTMESFWSANGPKAELADSSGHYTATRTQLEGGLRRIGLLSSPLTGLDNSGSYDFDEQAGLTAFAAGRTAFLRHWPYAYGELKAAMPRGAKIGVARLPGGSALGGQDLAVASASPRAAAAEQLIAYLTNPDSERCLLDAGFAATRTSSYRDDAQRCTKARTAGMGAADGENPAQAPTDRETGRPVYADTLLAALKAARARPQTPYYAAVTRAIQQAVHPILGSSTTNYLKVSTDLEGALREAFLGH